MQICSCRKFLRTLLFFEFKKLWKIVVLKNYDLQKLFSKLIKN